MAFLYDIFKVSKQEFDDIYANLGDNNLSWETLLMADWVYHHQDNDYDDGLSFMDRLYAKLGRFHPNWDIEETKDVIRNSNDPSGTYMSTIESMLADPQDVAYYGV